jgi:hypothetical protein
MSTSKSNNPEFLTRMFPNMRVFAGLLAGCIILTSFHVNAIDEIIDIKLNPVVAFDEVPVIFVVNSNLKFEIDVIITESNKVYINIEELFKSLGIKCIQENQGNNLTGFIENESKTYNIDYVSSEITIGNKTIKAVNGFLKESGGIYVESTVITEAFGLNIIFNFRSLSIKLEANFELPALKQLRLEQMRQNVSKLQSKSEVSVDTVIGRNYHIYNGGVIDWSVSSYQAQDQKINNKLSLSAGSELLGGEARVGFNYYSETDFDRRQLYYNWRWVDNENAIIRQAQLGKVGTQSIAYLRAPVVGASVNNSPNTIRKATGTYIINEYTEPNWTVELYINDALVDYTEADASGLFEFKVPIVYGYTTLKLKFYGPLGEERSEERTMNTPYTFMPAGTLEYDVIGGMLEDQFNSKFGRGVVNYGLNRVITIGGGVEYLSNIPDHPLIPFAKLAFQPFSRMVINLEYAQNVVINGLLNYTFGKSAFLELDYSKFTKGQQATINNTKEELKVRFSFPYKISKITGNTKLTYNQFVYDRFNFNQLNAIFSGRYKNFSANTTIASNWTIKSEPYMNATLDLSYRMRNGLMIRPSAQYNITEHELMRTRIELEKRLARMSFSVAYERNAQYATNNVYLNLRYVLPFARTGVTTSWYNNKFSASETAQGSLAFGDKKVKAGSNSSLGKGGILFYPFLDLNQNGILDKGEQMVLLSKVRVSGGRAVISEKDSIVRISDLNAFVDYVVEFSDNDLVNIALRFTNKTYQVLVDPNQYKKVYVPIVSVGEVSGMVYLNSDDAVKGLGRITIQIINEQGNTVAKTLSESDGYFNYLGLKPGIYTVQVDPEQLDKLNYQTEPLQHNLVINASVDGDIIEGLDFVLQSQELDSLEMQNNEAEPEIEDLENDEMESAESIRENTPVGIMPSPAGQFSVVKDTMTLITGGTLYKVQLLALATRIKQKDYFTKLQDDVPGLIIEESLGEDGLYHYSTGAFRSLSEAKNLEYIIRESGWIDCFVAIYERGKRAEMIYRINRKTNKGKQGK